MKRSGKRSVVCGCVTVALSLSTSALAFAQESAEAAAPAAAEPAAVAPAAAEPAAPAPAAANLDGGRFRFGVAGGAGLLSGADLSLWYGGVDLRFGYQVNDMIGIYAQPQLGVYGGDAGYGAIGTGGLIGTSAVVDFTFADQFFVGGGLGYAILNNPSGMELHLRAGGYPLYSDSSEKARRKGLMLGADLRLHFVEGYTFVAPTVNIGYEAY
jgi:hypothetical protein